MSVVESGAVVPRIPYEERRAIGKLLDAHFDAYKGRLRAMIVFGDLVTTGQTYDIDLLEVVDGWSSSQQGRLGEFRSSADLPLRGRLRLYFLAPQEFEHPEQILDERERRWVYDLRDRATRGYEIILESPPGYARRVLEAGLGISTLTAPPSGRLASADPLDPAARPGK
jgi:hypothetical protein